MDFKNIFGEVIQLGDTQYVEQVEGISRRLKDYFESAFKEFGIPKFVIVLGTSGPKNLVKNLDTKKIVSYAQLGFPISKAKGHAPEENGPEAKVHYGLLGGVPILICIGRIHYYECRDMDRVTLMVRSICLLGIKDFILTNASGGLIKKNRSHCVRGSIVYISSFLNEMGSNPLMGQSDYFHSFSDPNNVLKNFNEHLSPDNFPRLYSAIYTAVPGPVFETKPEADKFARDADLIGMSTVPELIAIGQQGGNAVVFSLVTNLVASGGQVTHEDNLKIVSKKDEEFSKIIFYFVKSFHHV